LKRFVLDCSVTLAWCFEDEVDDYADAVLEALLAGEALVPPVWPLEVANVLAVGERRKRLTPAQSLRFTDLLQSLPIVIDADSVQRPLTDILSMARELVISSYDASYLDLAVRSGLPLATRDGGLITAAKRYGVTRFEPESAPLIPFPVG
jgi:predicted nucleic acid-binding protein